jgi:OmcA/MtrC family decaheme c-type cytochrome
VTVTRDVVRQRHNKCHDPLALHGGNRRSVEVCVICHQPQTSDQVSGNTVDFKVMIHKIHTSRNLPSVLAGGKYTIGSGDFSDIGFPAYPDTRNCVVCHDQSSAAKQKDAYLKPSRAACGSCHDNVNFATGENHVDLRAQSVRQLPLARN